MPSIPLLAPTWKFESQTLDPREFCWVYNGSFEPVGSNDPIAPSPILEFISWNCQVSITGECFVTIYWSLTSRCTCHRIGMGCTVHCTNSVVQQIEEELKIIEHFFKIFLKFFVKGYYEKFDKRLLRKVWFICFRHVFKFFTAILVLISMTILFT